MEDLELMIELYRSCVQPAYFSGSFKKRKTLKSFAKRSSAHGNRLHLLCATDPVLDIADAQIAVGGHL